jgi:hypothetical protein
MSSLQATWVRLRYSNSKSSKSPEYARALLPPCKAHQMHVCALRLQIALNPSRANEVAHWEGCAVSTGTLKICGMANRSASSKCEDNWEVHTGRSECSDRYSDDRPTIYMRRSCTPSRRALTYSSCPIAFFESFGLSALRRLLSNAALSSCSGYTHFPLQKDDGAEEDWEV